MTDSSLASPAALESMTYRLDSYEALLRSFQETGYEFSRFDADDPPVDGEILLRHDVDLSVERALAMAEREHEIGVNSTYCVLLSSPAYDLTQPRNIRILRRISKLGHDLALHFDTHRYWESTTEPSNESVAAKVADELTLLGRLVEQPLSTASFHIPPEWVLDCEFDGITNTYSPPFFSEIGYLSDSSQKWTTTKPFPEGVPDAFQLLVHPGLWHADHRPMSEIVAERRDDAHIVVDHYFDPLGE